MCYQSSLEFLVVTESILESRMGVSDPEIQKKVFGPRWEHEMEKQGWPLWKRLIHRLQDCPICRPKGEQAKGK